MPNNLPAPRSLFDSLSTDRKNLATIQNGAFLERTEDEAQLYLTLGKMHDIGIATRHAFDEGGDIVADYRRRVGEDPLVAKALAPFLEGGLEDLDRVRSRLGRGF